MPRMSIMIKPSSSRCNLRCQYCFYRDEADNRTVADFGVMDNDTFDCVVAKAAEYAKGEGIHLTFQGGEPLLAGKEYFLYVLNRVKDYPDDNISISVQTNGTLLDHEWAKMFKQNNVLLGVSLDGNKKANLYRTTVYGKNSFDDIISGINILKAENVDFNVLVVATPIIAKNIAEIYAFFKRNKIKYLQFIPCLSPMGATGTMTLSPQEYGEMLNVLFELYRRDYRCGEYVSIRYFDNLISTARQGVCEQCGLGGVCMQQYVIEANGNVYPCDFYCLDNYLLGNIKRQSFGDFHGGSEAFISEVAAVKAECKSCPYFQLCRGGGCKREQQAADYCLAYKIFFSQNYYNILNF